MYRRIIDPRSVRIAEVSWPTVTANAAAVPGEAAGVDTSALVPHQVFRDFDLELEQAYQKGWADGALNSRQQSEKDIVLMLDRLAATLSELAHYRAKLRAQAEQDLVRLSIAIARRVLSFELSVNPESVQGLIHAALQKIRFGELLRVHLHPSHEQAVRERLQGASSPQAVEVIADSNLEPGSIVFETTRGSLDASFESQLQEIERSFLERIGAPA